MRGHRGFEISNWVDSAPARFRGKTVRAAEQGGGQGRDGSMIVLSKSRLEDASCMIIVSHETAQRLGQSLKVYITFNIQQRIEKPMMSSAHQDEESKYERHPCALFRWSRNLQPNAESRF